MTSKIEPKEIKHFNTNIFEQWDKKWLLLTCGDFKLGSFNTMTVAWGGFGIMWNLPIAMVVVRPSRFTYEFINRYETFTLCGFDEKHRKALTLLGTKSGRDSDKIAESGLTPIAVPAVAAPGFEQATLVISCKKVYFSDFKPKNFLDGRIEKQYGGADYHRMFYGEVVNILDES